MDLEEWEILPRDVFLDLDKEEEEKNIVSGKRESSRRIVFNKDYFVCPSLSPRKIDDAIETIEEVTNFPIDVVTLVPSAGIKNLDSGSFKAAQDAVSQALLFKKMKENEFADMKTDSPEAAASPRGKNIMPQIDACVFGFNDKSDCARKQEDPSDLRSKKSDEVEGGTDLDDGNGGMNIWKWSLNGFGAIFSFGIAAASFGIIILRSNERTKHQGHNHKLRFKIYPDDKAIKEAANHATKLNKAISGGRGAPITTAQISFGGYYHGL